MQLLSAMLFAGLAASMPVVKPPPYPIYNFTRQVNFNMTDFDLDDHPADANAAVANAQKPIAKRVDIAGVGVGGGVTLPGLNITLPKRADIAGVGVGGGVTLPGLNITLP